MRLEDTSADSLVGKDVATSYMSYRRLPDAVYIPPDNRLVQTKEIAKGHLHLVRNPVLLLSFHT